MQGIVSPQSPARDPAHSEPNLAVRRQRPQNCVMQGCEDRRATEGSRSI